MKILNKWQRHLLLPLLLIMITCAGGWAANQGDGPCGLQTTGTVPLVCPAVDFLNDRSADIIASNPLLVPGFLTPAGLSGKGQIVGIADSGLDKGNLVDIHPDLESEAGKMPRIAMLRSYSGRDVPDDPIGHGTHMAAAIAGSGKASNGQYRGIASGASLYFQALLDPAGQLKVPDLIDELYKPAYQAGVRIHVNGWGGGNNTYTSRSAQIDKFVYSNPDFLPVFGAGNNGPAKSSLTAEANSKNALTVGSSQVPRPAFGTEARYADQISPSSSQGPAGDGRIKPELLAPGSAVISACSSLVESTFAANTLYTMLGGTSMASAITGGALALLSEYLETEKHMSDPSSAFLKALLVNGANPLPGGPSTGQGFGIMDLTGTILALQEQQFHTVDNYSGISNNQTIEYNLTVDQGGGSFKATLAWADPPAAAGAGQALVNNLDLVLKDPHGRIFYGNDFWGYGQADSLNNIEQVTINNVVPGEYKVIIRGTRITGNQNFALVYGQPLQNGIVKSQEGRVVELHDGSRKDLTTYQVYCLSNDKMTSWPGNMAAGSDIYISNQTAYIIGRTWSARGVQVLPESSGNLLLEMNKEARQGGFYIEPGLDIEKGGFYLNTHPIDDINEIPPGSEINALINPALQNIWQIQAACEEKKGFIDLIDTSSRKIKLLRDEKTYPISEQVTISYVDRLLDYEPIDAPYGTQQTARLENLAPGLKVSLSLSPGKQEVQYIKVERELVVGQVKEVDEGKEEIVLRSGGCYKIFPGVMIIKDQKESSLKEIEPGDHIAALLLNDSKDIIQLYASKNVYYGRMLYYSNQEKELYLQDNANGYNQIKKVMLDQTTAIFRRGLQIDAPSIPPGAWVRVVSSPAARIAWRVDVAEIGCESSSSFSYYDPDGKKLHLQDGSVISYSPCTQLLKGGYGISPEMLIAGELLKITTLASLTSGPEFIARIEAEINPGAVPPILEAKAFILNGVLIIQGQSSAGQVYIWREDKWQPVTVESTGSFSQLFRLGENEQEIRMLAIDRTSGSIKGLNVSLKVFPQQESKGELIDLAGHPRETELKQLLGQGIISGYGDGSFRPEQAVTRVEFISMLARALKWSIEDTEIKNYFTDNREVPWWALGAVYAARDRGIVHGYADGSLGPYRQITKAEAEMIVAAAAARLRENASSQEEAEAAPVFTGSPYTNKQPDHSLTRAEAALLIGQLQTVKKSE